MGRGERRRARARGRGGTRLAPGGMSDEGACQKKGRGGNVAPRRLTRARRRRRTALPRLAGRSRSLLTCGLTRPAHEGLLGGFYAGQARAMPSAKAPRDGRGGGGRRAPSHLHLPSSANGVAEPKLRSLRRRGGGGLGAGGEEEPYSIGSQCHRVKGWRWREDRRAPPGSVQVETRAERARLGEPELVSCGAQDLADGFSAWNTFLCDCG